MFMMILVLNKTLYSRSISTVHIVQYR